MTKKLLIALATLALAAFALRRLRRRRRGDSARRPPRRRPPRPRRRRARAERSRSRPTERWIVRLHRDGADRRRAGANTVELDNPSSTPHNVCVEDDGGERGGGDRDGHRRSRRPASAELEAGDLHLLLRRSRATARPAWRDTRAVGRRARAQTEISAADRVGYAAGLLVALDLDGEAGDLLEPAAVELVDRDDLGASRGRGSRPERAPGSGPCSSRS